MPRAFDRRTPVSDKNPLANLLSWDNWEAVIGQSAGDAGESIRNFNINLATLAANIGTAAQEFAEAINDFLASIGLDPAQFSDPEFDAISFLIGWVDEFLLPNTSLASWQELYESLTGDATGDLVKITNFLITQLFGPVTANRIPFVPVSHIGESSPNLLAGYTFENADVISGGEGIWTWDGDVGHSGPGSVSVNADGTSRELLSIDIAVSEGHTFDISAWVKWEGLAGTGTPIQLAVTAYHADDATEQAVIASHNTTPSTTDWLLLSGTYQVPADCTLLRVRLVVAAGATAGQVWWDDISASKHQPLIQRLISGSDPFTSPLLPDDIANLFGAAWQNALDILTKASQGDHDNLLNALDPSGTLSAIEDRLNAMLHPGSILNADQIGTGQIGDLYVPGLGTIHDNLVTRLLRVGGSGYTPTDSATALETLTHALVDVSARNSQLEAIFTGGVSEGDSFERTSSSSLGSGWLVSYTAGASGIWATPNGHEASWITAGFASREFLAIRDTGNVRSTTDLQEVAMVLSSVAPNFLGLCGYNSVWLRITDSTSGISDVTGIKVEWGGDGSLLIARYLNGTPTVLNILPPGSIVPPGPGARIAGLAGEPGTARLFSALIGTSQRLEIPEVGTASALGPAARRWGHGGRATGTIIGQRWPASVHQWTARDQLLA